MLENLVALPILIHIFGAVLCIFTIKYTTASKVISLLTSTIGLICSIVLLISIQKNGIQVVQSGAWEAPFGISLVGDLLSGFMTVLASIISFAISIYSLKGLSSKYFKNGYYFFYHLMISGVIGSFLTGDLFNLYVWFEVMLMASFSLMVIGGAKENLKGGVKYVLINLIASTFFLISAALIFGRMGTLNFADLSSKISMLESSASMLTPALLLIIAFSVKAGLFPFFFWLPASYHNLKPVIVASFAGLLTKVGVYSLIRAYTLLFHSLDDVLFNFLFVISILSMVIGVLGAASKYSIKKILSFHIISQIGYKTLGLALFTPLGVASCLFYMAHNMITKTNLFLIGGIVEKHLGTDDLKKLGGLFKSKLYLSVLFLITALSLGGIPPLSGFFAKFLVIKASFESESWIGGFCAIAVGMLSLFSMIKIWAEAFLKKSEDIEVLSNNELALDKSMLIPATFMTALIILMGLGSSHLFSFTMDISNQILDPLIYIRAVLGK